MPEVTLGWNQNVIGSELKTKTWILHGIYTLVFMWRRITKTILKYTCRFCRKCCIKILIRPWIIWKHLVWQPHMTVDYEKQNVGLWDTFNLGWFQCCTGMETILNNVFIGTNVEEARRILDQSGMPLKTAGDMDEAARLAVRSIAWEFHEEWKLFSLGNDWELLLAVMELVNDTHTHLNYRIRSYTGIIEVTQFIVKF